MSEDPIKFGMHWYAYCSNNPINYIDPSGLENLKVLDEEDRPSNGQDIPSTFQYVHTDEKNNDLYTNSDESTDWEPDGRSWLYRSDLDEWNSRVGNTAEKTNNNGSEWIRNAALPEGIVFEEIFNNGGDGENQEVLTLVKEFYLTVLFFNEPRRIIGQRIRAFGYLSVEGETYYLEGTFRSATIANDLSTADLLRNRTSGVTVSNIEQMNVNNNTYSSSFNNASFANNGNSTILTDLGRYGFSSVAREDIESYLSNNNSLEVLDFWQTRIERVDSYSAGVIE